MCECAKRILSLLFGRDYVKRKAISYNDAALWQTYRTLRNMVTSTVRRKKKLYYDSKISDCQSNPKQLWNVIGQLVRSDRRTTQMMVAMTI